MDENISISLEYNLNRICRLCLNEYDELKSIFQLNEYYNSQPLHEIIMACAQIQIMEDDGMPNKVCVDCERQIILAYNFKIRCEQSDNKLRSYIIKKYPTRNIKFAISESSSNYIKQEDQEYSLAAVIKPEISVIEDDPLNGNFYTSNGREFNAINQFNNQHSVDNVGPINNGIQQNNLCDGIQQSISCDDDSNNDFNDNCDHLLNNDDDEDDDDEQVKKDELSIYIKNDPDSDFNEEKFDYQSARNEQGRYSCHICQKTLVDAKGLKLHIRLHTGNKLKRCDICNRGFAKQNHLNRHLVIHKEKPAGCDECSLTFPTHSELKMHLLTHGDLQHIKKNRKSSYNDGRESDIKDNSAEKFALCKICDMTFTQIKPLQIHLLSHMDENSFLNVNLHAKLFLFDLTKITPNIENHDTLIKYVINDIKANSLTRFYQITNQNGYEYQLSDSESEDEQIKELNTIQTTTNIPHQCPECDHIFNRSYKLNLHLNINHGNYQNQFPCGDCGRKYPTEFLLNRHFRRQCNNKLKQYSCSLCKFKFMWQYSYELHNEKFHSGKKIKRSTIASTLDLLSVDKKSKSMKEKPKEKNYTCVTCNKSFYRQEHLDRHTKIHIPSEKKFECTICQKKFNRKDNLRSHMRVHKDDKEDTDKHLCVYCGRSFSNSSNLIVHMRRHTGEKPYKCDLCDKGFPRSSDLQCHRRTHTGEKPCLCTICGKGFSRSNKLVRHMRIHTGVRPYKCTHCDRAFTQSNDLTLHIRRHTGEKPYVCGICGDRFIQGTALQTHRRVHGHYEENQPAPFASISVNNPNRYTNANRVNRIGFIPPITTLETTANSDIKPIISRRSIPNTTNLTHSTTTTPSLILATPSPNVIQQQPQQQMISPDIGPLNVIHSPRSQLSSSSTTPNPIGNSQPTNLVGNTNANLHNTPSPIPILPPAHPTSQRMLPNIGFPYAPNLEIFTILEM